MLSFFTQVYRVHLYIRQEKMNSKVFIPKRPRNADVSATLAFSTAIYKKKGFFSYENPSSQKSTEKWARLSRGKQGQIFIPISDFQT